MTKELSTREWIVNFLLNGDSEDGEECAESILSEVRKRIMSIKTPYDRPTTTPYMIISEFRNKVIKMLEK